MTVGQQQTDTVGQEDTLLHRETLLVVSSSNPEDISLELVRDVVTGDFLRDFFVHKITDAAVIIDVDEFLGAGGRVWGRYLMGYIQCRERVYTQEMLSFILTLLAFSLLRGRRTKRREQNGGKVFVWFQWRSDTIVVADCTVIGICRLLDCSAAGLSLDFCRLKQKPPVLLVFKKKKLASHGSYARSRKGYLYVLVPFAVSIFFAHCYPKPPLLSPTVAPPQHGSRRPPRTSLTTLSSWPGRVLPLRRLVSFSVTRTASPK